ncbi:hypothetical protein QFZ94_008284 [Paraburkholderia sp. JPY465]
MQQTIKDRRGHGAVAKVAPPVLDDTVGRDEDAATLLVALMDQCLQQFGRGIGNAFGEEQIVKHEEFGLDQGLEQPVLIGTCFHGIAGEHGVGLDVSHLHSLQGGVVGDSLGDMTFAGAGFADQQRVVAVGDELQRV